MLMRCLHRWLTEAQASAEAFGDGDAFAEAISAVKSVSWCLNGEAPVFANAQADASGDPHLLIERIAVLCPSGVRLRSRLFRGELFFSDRKLECNMG